MRLKFIPPRPELRPYIEKLWFLETDCLLSADQSLIAPNGKHKIIIPYQNDLTTDQHDKKEICREHDVWFIGVRDVPVTIATPPGPSGSIGIELTIAGAYKFINVPLKEITNRIVSFTELYNGLGRQLQQVIVNECQPEEKVRIIQEFLFQQLRKTNRNNRLVDYCIGLITSSDGLMPIKEIQRRTGYSKRYLDMMFNAHVGLPPKTIATIVRFQRLYKSLAQSDKFLENYNIYDLYYDQSHFIREFKRYTGYSPMKYAKMNNCFGKNF